MIRKAAFLALLAALPLLSLPASARQQTKADIIRNHHMCVKYLNLKPAEKQAFARRAGHSAQTITKSCQFTTRMGIEKTWYYERMYQRETARGGSSSGGGRSRPAESSPATAGTCYSLSDCHGSSVQVSAKYNCPAGYGAFKPAHGGGGCEVR